MDVFVPPEPVDPWDLTMENKVSFEITQHSIKSVMNKFEHEIKLKELDMIKIPYSTKHVIQNSSIALVQVSIIADPKSDDSFINGHIDDEP